MDPELGPFPPLDFWIGDGAPFVRRIGPLVPAPDVFGWKTPPPLGARGSFTFGGFFGSALVPPVGGVCSPVFGGFFGSFGSFVPPVGGV